MRKSPIYVASIVAGLLLMVLSVVPMFSQETNAGETFAEQFYEKEIAEVVGLSKSIRPPRATHRALR